MWCPAGLLIHTPSRARACSATCIGFRCRKGEYGSSSPCPIRGRNRLRVGLPLASPRQPPPLKRNKALDPGRVQGRIVAALDGIEVLSSYSRCCDACLERRVPVRKGGVKVEQLQYYHRAVGCQIVSSPTKPFLALEWLQPGEGEDTAALRLLARLPEIYGSRFFDVLLLDALYAQAPVLKIAERIGWDLIVSLKQNQRDLYQSAIRLFTRRPADSSGTEVQGGK